MRRKYTSRHQSVTKPQEILNININKAETIFPDYDISLIFINSIYEVPSIPKCKFLLNWYGIWLFIIYVYLFMNKSFLHVAKKLKNNS